jgi:hypothetical protein
MNGSSNSTPICPCGAFVFPTVIFNPGRLSTFAYRVGDYTAFRHALLQALPGENELSEIIAGKLVQIWRPTTTGDLALQMMEWWAYLADVLTFYNERIANQAYLRTADLTESVNRLIQILGYRPRPGIGATGQLAALLNTTKPFTLPQGFQVQSKPGPGNQPQTFELDAATVVQPPDMVTAQPATPDLPLFSSDSSGNLSFWIAGKVTGIKPNDKLLLLNNNWPQQAISLQYAWLTVKSLQPQTDASGNAVTQVTFSIVNSIPANLQFSPQTSPQITDYQLLKSGVLAHLWNLPSPPPSSVVALSTSQAQAICTQFDDNIKSAVVLSSVVRQINVGDSVLVDASAISDTQSVGRDPVSGNNGAQLISVAAVAEQIWYANGTGASPPETMSPPVVPISIPITILGFNQTLTELQEQKTGSGPGHVVALASAQQSVIRYGWTSAGQLVAAPVPGANQVNVASSTQPLALQAIPPAAFPAGLDQTVVQIEDATGNGAQASATAGTDQTSITLGSLSVPGPSGSVPASTSLTFPLNILFNLLGVSRGKTVTNEVLGSGNGGVAGQDFTLKNSPVTYLQNPASLSGDNYSSTVKVSVNGVQWSEVRSFYGQPPNAQIFITKEDEQGSTHVVFGDGVNGSRLPSGTNNVVATYRYGSGADAPAAGTLTVVMQPQPGLKAIVNPIPVGGGSDPDPPAKVRQLAPDSVLTFGRAVSLDDFEVIAAAAPGVIKAKAAYAFDPLSQLPRVTIWVAGDSGAQASAYRAILAAADPNRLPSVLSAAQLTMKLQLTLILSPKYDQPTVVNAVQSALLDPDSGLLGTNVVGIGQVYYDSQIYAACLAVPGVEAVHGLSFSQPSQFSFEFRFFVPVTRLLVAGCLDDQRHDPGNGNYFYVPNDQQHFQISWQVAA